MPSKSSSYPLLHPFGAAASEVNIRAPDKLGVFMRSTAPAIATSNTIANTIDEPFLVIDTSHSFEYLVLTYIQYYNGVLQKLQVRACILSSKMACS